MISEIQTEYTDLQMLVTLKRTQTDSYHKKSLPVDDAKEIFEKIVRFQRFLESKQFQLKVYTGAAFFDRASQKLNEILKLVNSPDTLKTFDKNYKEDDFLKQKGVAGSFIYYDYIEGLVSEARELVLRSKSESITAQERSLAGMSAILDDIELHLVEFYYDVRLMSELMMFPVEQRMKLKGILANAGFKDSVAYIETAEQNLTAIPASPAHLKDALSNCRLSLEAMIYDILKSQGIVPTNRFSVDLAELGKKNSRLIDEPTKGMIQQTYSYLSVKGSHVFSNVDEKNMSEAEFGLDHTYRLLAHILTRLEATRKNPDKPQA